jgi:hypothetical protein
MNALSSGPAGTRADETGRTMNLRSSHPRLNALYEERDRDFPAQDPANTAVMRAALEAYADVIDAHTRQF